jgi:hypothetical protein
VSRLTPRASATAEALKRTSKIDPISGAEGSWLHAHVGWYSRTAIVPRCLKLAPNTP